MDIDETDVTVVEEAEPRVWWPGALLGLLLGAAIMFAAFSLLDADHRSPAPKPPTVRLMGLPTLLQPGQQYQGEIVSRADRFLLAYSDRIDVQRFGHTLRVSSDRAGAASITVRAIRGNLVSKPAQWHGSVSLNRSD